MLFYSFSLGCSAAAGAGSAAELCAATPIPAPQLIIFFRQAHTARISAGLLFSRWWRLLCSCSPCSVPVWTTVQTAHVLAASSMLFLVNRLKWVCSEALHRDVKQQWGHAFDQIVVKFVNNLAV